MKLEQLEQLEIVGRPVRLLAEVAQRSICLYNRHMDSGNNRGERVSLSDQVRQAVEGSELTRYRICKEIGLVHSTMSHFMRSQCGLSMATLDRLAALLDLHISVGNKKQEET